MLETKSLEQLLNKLIELGRKPRGLKATKIIVYSEGDRLGVEVKGKARINIGKQASYNDLCSLDSGLWQFVCRVILHDFKGQSIRQIIYDHEDVVYPIISPEYRLMLSSIQDNKENFLLSNIQIDASK